MSSREICFSVAITLTKTGMLTAHGDGQQDERFALDVLLYHVLDRADVPLVFVVADSRNDTYIAMKK